MFDDFKPSQAADSQVPKIQNDPQPTARSEPAFRLPEAIAAGETSPVASSAPKNKKRLFGYGSQQHARKQAMIIGAVVGVLLLASGGGVYAFVLRKKPAPAAQAVVETPEPPAPPPAPTTETSSLMGLEVPIGSNATPVTGIMIENSPDARPQSGLKDAGVVVEMLVEGGITRFLALFQETQPDYVGPVRSLRPPYIDFVMAFDAAIAHAGGSGAALAQVKSLGLKDMDHGPNGAYFHRVSTRYAPHNLYTSLGEMLALQKSKGYSSSFTPLLRKKDGPSPTPNAKAVDVALSGYLYNSHWDYDVASNSYLRSEGGRPHLDEKSGAQIKSKVVLVLVMPQHYEGIYSVYATTGTGVAYIFQDGIGIQCTWSRPERKSQITLTDQAGTPVALNTGNTWITLASTPDQVKFAP